MIESLCALRRQSVYAGLDALEPTIVIVGHDAACVFDICFGGDDGGFGCAMRVEETEAA